MGAGVVAAVLVGCGNTATTTPAGSSSTSRPTDIPAPTQWKIKADDLPPGWQGISPPTGDFGGTLCGVEFEPTLAIRAGVWQWAPSDRKTLKTPALVQWVRVYNDDQAHKVIAALQAVLRSCTKDAVPLAEGSKQKVTFSIEPIAIAGAGPETVAWRQTSALVNYEVVMTRRGRSLVQFYTVGEKLDRDVLARAVAALQSTPQS